jgi:PEP-CTERM motif
MKIALRAAAATALLCLSAHAGAVPVLSVHYSSEDLPDTEPAQDRWVLHYTMSAGEGLTAGTLFGIRFDVRFFDDLSIDVLGNPAVAGSVRQPNAAEKIPGFAILKPLTELQYKDLISFDVAFDRLARSALPMTQTFDVAAFDGKEWRIVQHGTAERRERPVPAIPEPATLALLGSGLLGIAAMCRRKTRVSPANIAEARV